MVFVLSKDGNPLMPTKRHGKVKHLLRDGMAKVVQRTPFTIQLNYDSDEYTQPITLGVDAGSKSVGISASTAKEELFSAEAQLRNDIVELIADRAMYRRNRRSRKTRYREARFDNRNKGKGWLAPSIRHKIDSHMRLVRDIHRILPITEIVIEVASFDIQKIINPEISGTLYQQGDQMDFWNMREYVLFRDGHECQFCHGKSKDVILNAHHIESRKTGGDAPNNLVTVCETCHGNHHDRIAEFRFKRGQTFKDATFMGIMRWALYEQLKAMYPKVRLTYGYITKNTRITNKLDKTHGTDAFCITGNIKANRSAEVYNQRFVRKNNRSLHKANASKGGKRKANKAPYTVHGYRLFDKVLHEGQECFIYGRRATGYFDLRLLDGTRWHASAKCKELKLLQASSTLLTERRTRIPPAALEAGVSCAKF